MNWLRRLFHRHDWVNDDNPYQFYPIYAQHCTVCKRRSFWDAADRLRFMFTHQND